MNENSVCKEERIPRSIDISDEDVYDAMKEIPGYLDITPGDFTEVYRHAYARAVERLSRNIKAGDVMTKKVISVKNDTPLVEAAQTLGDQDISGFPVVHNSGIIVGILSEKNFLSHMGAPQNKMTFMKVVAECLKGKGCAAVSIRGQTACDIMTSPAVTVVEDTSIVEIANTFTKKNINRVPVMDEKGRMVGIVSRADIVRHSF